MSSLSRSLSRACFQKEFGTCPSLTAFGDPIGDAERGSGFTEAPKIMGTKGFFALARYTQLIPYVYLPGCRTIGLINGPGISRRLAVRLDPTWDSLFYVYGHVPLLFNFFRYSRRGGVVDFQGGLSTHEWPTYLRT